MLVGRSPADRPDTWPSVRGEAESENSRGAGVYRWSVPLIAVTVYRSSGAITTPTVAGNGINYDLVTSTNNFETGGDTDRIYLFRGTAAYPSTAIAENSCPAFEASGTFRSRLGKAKRTKVQEHSVQ